MSDPAIADPLTFAGTFGDFLAVAGLVAANGFFVASEFALVSVRKSRIDEMVAAGVSGAKGVQNAVRDLDRYIAGTQVGITIASLALGWVGEPALVPFVEPVLAWFGVGSPAAIHGTAIAVAFAMITFLHVVLGELVPKSLALQKPEGVSLWVARPLWLVVLLFQPLIWALNGTGNWLLRRLGVEPADGHASVHSAEELSILVRQSHEAGVLDDDEQKMLERTFRFGELKVRDVMVPRTEVDSLNLKKPVDELLDKLAKTRHSRMPVHHGDVDHVVGVLHSHDVFQRLRAGGPIDDLAKLAKPALHVPATMPLDALLKRFQEERTHIAIAIDEYGATAGLVTLEDLVEEVFGEVQDSPEAALPRMQRLEDGRMVIRGECRIEEVNEFAGLHLDDADADTLAGYVMHNLGRAARLQDRVETPEAVLIVTDMAQRRIKQVSVRLKQPEGSTETTPTSPT
jgi:putative hemolysin